MSPVPLAFHYFHSLPLLNSWCFTEALHTHPKGSDVSYTNAPFLDTDKQKKATWVSMSLDNTAPSEIPKMPSIHTALH